MKILKTKTFNSIRAKEIKAFERRQKRYQSLIMPTNDSKREVNSIKTSKIINKDHNVKFQKQSIFNKNTFHKYKGRISDKNNIRLQKEEKTNEENSFHKNEKKINDKTANKLEIKAPALDNKENTDIKVNKKKLNRKILTIQNDCLKTYSKELDLGLRIEKKKTHIIKKKISTKKLNFEQALKKKKNLAKTKYNLFSPDKFTNT